MGNTLNPGLVFDLSPLYGGLCVSGFWGVKGIGIKGSGPAPGA